MSTDPQATEQGSELVPSEQSERALSVQVQRPSDFERILGGGGVPAIHNFTGDPMAQWRMVAKATNGEHGDIDSAVGHEIALKHFYCHAVQINGDTPGEIVDAVRCVLFDVDGRSWAFASEGIARSLAQLVQAIGFGPWEQPPLIRVTLGKTRAKRNFYSIVPA